ncbi:MAG: hypothetical protein HY724_12340 [Candidatus Rokubacteria bacterium]|nr:hypothetical protein [Candidatus Rokubacteria bacterium]
MVLVDAVKHGFLEPLLGGGCIAVAQSALGEVRYYRAAQGNEHPIDLTPHTQTGRLTVVAATATEVEGLVAKGLQRRLGQGELESLALVVSRGHDFCTADKAAVREMKDLGVLGRWISLEELLARLNPPRTVPDPKYLRAPAEPKD